MAVIQHNRVVIQRDFKIDRFDHPPGKGTCCIAGPARLQRGIYHRVVKIVTYCLYTYIMLSIQTKGNDMNKKILMMTLCAGTVLADGSSEEGFVAPPKDRKLPPAPPRSVSSAETLLCSCCCPVTPLSRTEAKRPPKPPVAVTKLQH